MNAKRIVFRVDAGLDIGTGHVMRCLTLADALRQQKAKVDASRNASDEVRTIFVTRAHRGHIIPEIIGCGHRVVTLPGNTDQPYGRHPAPPDHASWLEADWRSDAADTRQILEYTNADWLVTDHYALDRCWQEAALPHGVRLLVLDDLADRPHVADVLLDQNAGRRAEDYDGLVPAFCDTLIGPMRALLRPEFAWHRARALARREVMERPKRLLITLGGIDRYNATGKVLEALAQAPAAVWLEVSVVIGGNAPALAEVQAQAAAMPMSVEVAVNVSDMAERMTQADLCIGAAGSTAWERCALGLPTLQIALADNQMEAAEFMACNGLALALPFPDAPEFAFALRAGLEHLTQPDTYRVMARRAADLTDGAGARRLAARLGETTLD